MIALSMVNTLLDLAELKTIGSKISYKEASPQLDQEFYRLVAALTLAPDDPVLQSSAAALARVVHSRCIDLATWKADLSPEYKLRETQAAELTRLAGEQADAILKHNFGPRRT